MKAKDTLFYRKKTINCNGSVIDLSEPKIMAIINITPDSFYDGGRYFNKEDIEKRVKTCMEEGADILDVGAYSSRPGAEDINAGVELKRLAMAMEIIRKEYPGAIVSIDTFRSEIVRRMIEEFDVNIVNDISGGQLDPDMFNTVADYGIPYILMHMQGKPDNMQKNPHYEDVFREVMTFFAYKTDQLQKKGVKDIIIDPGFGFGKSLNHNYEMMNYLQDFKSIGCPVMVGFSRKSMIYKLLETTPENALNGTTALHMAALIKGSNILRVHDVKEACQVLKIFETMNINERHDCQ